MTAFTMKIAVLIHLFLALFLFQLKAQTIVRGPYLQKGSETSITVKWRTSVATESKIDYGTNLNNLNQTVNDNTAKVDHELEINGLSQDTKYFYRVANTAGILMPASSDLYFKTHPTIGTVQPINVWVLGDCGTGNSNARSVRDAYYNYAGNGHTDAILMLGDNAYTDGTDAEYQIGVFENMYEDKLKNTILWSCIGNHERVNQSGAYFDIFTLPTSGESGGLASGTESYYSFDYGNIHFICLDSDASDRNVGGPMYVWAENDIQNTTQDWIVAFWHHPTYTKGTHDSDTESKLIDMRENLAPMLENNGVDLILSGHSHTYERSYFLKGHYGMSTSFNANTHTVGANGNGDGQLDGDGAYLRTTNGNAQNDGAVYITAGSSGKTGSGTLDHPAMFYSVSELGSCVLEVDGNEMNVKFLRDNGVIEDYFTIRKEAINCTLGAPCDDEDPYTTNDVYTNDCFCVGTVIGGSACVKITNGADDVEENSAGVVDATSTDLELVEDAGMKQKVGLRFNLIDVPQGANITQAYLQFTVDEPNSDVTNLVVSGEDTNNAVPFATTNFELTNKTKTSATVNWSPPAWTTEGASGLDQRTPDLSSILQEIVDRPGYSQNNSIALFVSGTGERTAESYNGSSSAAPQLCINYTTAAGCPTMGLPCDDGLACTVNDVIDNNCKCSGTFQDGDNDGFCDAEDQCPNFDDALIGTTCDDGDSTTINDVYTNNCICEGFFITGNSVCRRISVGADDAEESTDNGNVDLGSSDIELVFDWSNQVAGFRFSNISIPQGAFITNASIQFAVDETTTGTANLTIHGEAADDASMFTSSTNNLSSRISTTATVNWSPPDWNTEGEAGPDQQTPDLSAIIQEIVDRPGFRQDNSIVLLVTGTGKRTAESFNGDGAAAALLCIEFSIACPTTGQTCNDNNPCTINDVIDNDCNCIGTFQDSDNDSVCDAEDQCPNFDDNLIGTSCDDGNSNTSGDVYTTDCICEGTIGGNSVCRRIGVGADDAEENSTNGFVNLGSSDIELVFDGNDQIAALRFNNISIPQGATITNAHLQFTVDEVSTGTSNLIIHGEDIDNASAFTTTTSDLSSRITTSASVNWSPPDWNTEGEAGPNQQTPDLSAIIQEIVDRPSFSQDNSVVLLITGTGKRTAESYNGDDGKAAELCIEYSSIPSLTYDLKVFLEGAYYPISGNMRNNLYSQELLPGMLFLNPSNTGLQTPPGQPYNLAPWNYQGTEGLTFSNSDYDPLSVDWVLMSLRTGVDAATEIHQAAGILKRDGTIEFLPGSAYQGGVPGPYFVLIEHRNHMGALSAQALVPQNGVLVYDFTAQNSWVPQTNGFGQKELAPGFWGLYAGDGDQISDPVSFDINGADRILWNLKNGLFNRYTEADYNMNGEVTGADRIIWNNNSGINSSVPK